VFQCDLISLASFEESSWTSIAALPWRLGAELACAPQVQVLQNVETPAYEDTWVTVFGLSSDSSATSTVLQEMQACGNIQSWLSPPLPSCNWMYVQFESRHGAQRALQRNGSRLGQLGIMIGVQPPSAADRQHIANRSQPTWVAGGMQPVATEAPYVLSSSNTQVL
jgi:hypothetical protein